jgi:hypothetical protein
MSMHDNKSSTSTYQRQSGKVDNGLYRYDIVADSDYRNYLLCEFFKLLFVKMIVKTDVP